MSFTVGETVVYPNHGAAVIESLENRVVKGEERQYLVLRILSQPDLVVRVPAANLVGEEGQGFPIALSALDGGPDGLDFYKSIASGWSPVLKNGGLLAFECGIGQSEAVQDILASADFNDIAAARDTLGIERVITGIKR